MSYFPITVKDQAEMLETIGIEHFGQMFQAIPNELRNPKIDLPSPLSELETQSWFRELAGKNASSKTHSSFLGAGSYEHFIPAIVRHIIGRGEFYTSYTPYQPEASQGTLQALFEYQSLICELTGMDVSNGSHYDGSTALAESVLMTLHETKRRKVLMARSVHPDYRTVTQTYLTGTSFETEEIPFQSHFGLDLDYLKKHLTPDVASVVVASPNFFGLVEDLKEVETLVHQNGSLLILVSHPLSFGFYKSAKEWGADIVCGEGQPLGIPPGFGGPWLGYLAATRSLLRRIPGRLVGLTQDNAGRRAFCLTLQAREQHIRRERASSNICTNQALCAIAACVYMASLGKTGIRRIAELNLENAYYLRRALSNLKEVEILTDGSIFNEFVIRLKKPVDQVNQSLFQKGIISGLALERFYPELKEQMLVCATETKSKDQLDQFVEALKEVLK
ncbi:MAG: glycine dehydrogenase (aminomethyl-transferring) [Omnitrophica bacterium RIFCSPHIGHO2_02_FULL_46_11]|nr:MAG: glycine dehydrogenase (aminomethyl-transferring) [Omnitrophica bacterium RIFCSPHIGHO2_02_FULL_46_11]OGW85919.1 MAG: glycine dehydrogenase (aminomethyl-transferring) [Omnitrophica bacterium RIFCSPLOWO2_01_FULL_45_10b]